LISIFRNFYVQLIPQRHFYTAGFAVYITLKLMTFSLVLTNEPRHVKEHCCAEMSEQANMSFPGAESPLLGSTDKRIYWSPVFNEYGLICQPSAEILQIHHCPFCGSRLPESRREKWFERLEKEDWKTWGDPIPSELLSHDWK
jgi:hypothetical protein